MTTFPPLKVQPPPSPDHVVPIIKVARFQGQYLPSLSINYVAIIKDLDKFLPQL